MALRAFVGLGLLLGSTLSSRVSAQCTLSGSLLSFEPNPPGASRGGTPFLGSGFSSNLALYQSGGTGPYRMLMQESYGYSVLDLSNPINPTALLYHDVRFPINGPNSVTHHGDGQNDVQTIAVAPDGQRVAFSTTGPAAPFQTVVGSPDGLGFILWGDFFPDRAQSTVIQHVGNRYLAYAIHSSLVTVADVTTLPSNLLSPDNMAHETTTWPGGYGGIIAGSLLLYQAGTSIQVVDASNPGPAGNITGAMPQTTITSSDFGGRSIGYFTALADPTDSTKVWVLVELNAAAGENSPSYGLLTISSTGLGKTSQGPTWRVPSVAGENWLKNPGPSSALIPANSGIFVLMWAQRGFPTLLFELYSTSAAAWSSASGAAPPGKFDIPTAYYSNFSPGAPMKGFAGTGSAVYAYLPTGTSAYMIPMSCVSQNAPAVATMSVTGPNGALASGDTVFFGDQITITPSVNPPPTSQPLTGFLWNFDFDFHPGVASEDSGIGQSPRLHAPDNTAFGNPQAPPATITLVGPCDPNTGGTPGSGTGCWTSVTTNGAFAGGAPDFTNPNPGATKSLTFAFEANNALGSAGASTFTLNWKVPAARLQNTQVLSGVPLVSGSDGHPTAAGYKWYFGTLPTSLTLSTCTTSACVPSLDTKGTYSYWLTVTYPNGYTTPDYTGASAMGTYTVTDFAPAFTVNGATSGPITAVTNQNLTVVNSSQRGATVTASGGFYYSLCNLNGQSSCADNYILWPTMGDAGPTGSPTQTATIPTPSVAGNFALKIRVNYTGGQAFWPDPNGTNYFGLNIVDVQPLVASASVNPSTTSVGQTVTFSCSATGGLAPYTFQWRYPISFVVSSTSTWQTTSPIAGNIIPSCFVSDSQPVPASSVASATATFTGGSPINVNVSASPTTALPNQTIVFSCNVSGGSGSYTYQWRSPAASSFVVGTGQSYQTSSPTAGTIQAGCTATDISTSASSSNSASVSVGNGGGGGSLSVGVSVTPNPGTVNQPVTFSCNASGGTPPYTYAWRSPATSGFVAGTNQTFSTYSNVPTTIQAGCTVTDSVGSSLNNATSVQIADAAPPLATCADVDFHLVDTATGLAIPISGNFLGQYFSVQTGQSIQFVAASTAALTSLAWTFGDGGTGSANNIVYAYPSSGSFTVSVTANGNAACVKSYLFQVSGPSGLFTAQYADGSVFSASRVDSGKAMTFTAGAANADSYTWAFGDGFTATGRTVTHAFVAFGTTNTSYTTTLNVTVGIQNLTSSQTFSVVPPAEAPKWFVAGLAYTAGLSNTQWQSDLTILNPSATLSATYSLAFLDGSHAVAPADLVWRTIVLGAQQSASASNVLSSFFGKSIGSYGAIIVRGDVAPVAPSITSRTYNNGGASRGTFGLSVPTTQATSGVSQQSSAAQQLLIGLRDDSSAHTNIVLVNLISTDWSHAHLGFFDATGTSLGVLNVDVPPYGVAQLTKPLTGDGWLNQPSHSVYRVQVTVDPGGAVFPYATVIDELSTDPIVVTPTEHPLNTYRVPGIVRLAGANNTVWRSRFVLHNPSTSARKVSVLFSYVPCDATGCGGRQISSGPGDVSLGAGETRAWDDFPAAWLTAVPGGSVSDSVSYGNSFIDVAPAPGDANLDPLLVLGETFNSQPTGPVGLQLSGFTDLDGGSKTGAGKRLLLTGLASDDTSDSGFRTNAAFFLTSGTSGYFNVRVLSDTGVTLKSFGWNLTSSNPFKQFNDSDLFGGVNKSNRMSIIVDSFDGSPIAGYATIIDNKSGDATFVKAQPAP